MIISINLVVHYWFTIQWYDVPLNSEPIHTNKNSVLIYNEIDVTFQNEVRSISFQNEIDQNEVVYLVKLINLFNLSFSKFHFLKSFNVYYLTVCLFLQML